MNMHPHLFRSALHKSSVTPDDPTKNWFVVTRNKFLEVPVFYS
jgi:hypothetical protein